MGLDMYAYSRDKQINEDTEIAYWRKHNRLQGYMENLWISRGNTEDFNCKELELSEQDIDNLEKAINNMELPETEGFFFGNDSYDEYESFYKKIDLQFIKTAKEELSKGNKVIYNCWW